MPIPPSVHRWMTAHDSDPSIRARYLTQVGGLPESNPAVRRARRRIGREGWAAQLLSQQFADGHWASGPQLRERSGGPSLYRPKYTSTIWVAIVLAELGMDRSDRRVRATAELLLRTWGGPKGPLGGTESETCQTGNMVRTLIAFGYLDHPEVARSIRWLLRAQKPDGGWHCWASRTGTLDGWEALAGLGAIPPAHRSTAVDEAIERGAEFFLERRLSREGAERYAPWFRIHFPNHYYYDVLVGLRLMVDLGYARDRRVRPALDWLESRRLPNGRWPLDVAHPDLEPTIAYQMGQVHYPMVLEPPGRPSRIATLEALRVLRATGRV
ncbi:MAG: hypothetical protein ACREBT_00675 [Thermoplasmata archaeon]